MLFFSGSWRKLKTIMIGVLLSGCTSTQTVMDSWRGHHIDEVIAEWGAPNSSLTLTDGRSVYSWVSSWGSAYLLNTCRQSFTTDAEGVIQNWRFTGCPQWQTVSSKLFPGMQSK